MTYNRSTREIYAKAAGYFKVSFLMRLPNRQIVSAGSFDSMEVVKNNQGSVTDCVFVFEVPKKFKDRLALAMAILKGR